MKTSAQTISYSSAEQLAKQAVLRKKFKLTPNILKMNFRLNYLRFLKLFSGQKPLSNVPFLLVYILIALLITLLILYLDARWKPVI